MGCPSLDRNVPRTSREQCLGSREAIVTLGIWSWAVLVSLEVCVSGLSFENFCLYYRLWKRMAIVRGSVGKL